MRTQGDELLSLYEHQLRNCRDMFTAHMTEIEDKFGNYAKMEIVGLMAGIDWVLGLPVPDRVVEEPSRAGGAET